MGGPEKVGRPGAESLGPGADARLLRAYELLRSVFGNGAAGPWADGDGEPSGPWQPLPGPLEGDPWLVSATDLLVPWLPARQAIGPVPHDPWQGYFAPPDATAADGPESPAAAATAPEAAVAPTAPFDPLAPSGPSWQLGSLGPPGELEEPLAPGAAEAAADCLYAFLRACGRLDVEAAMALVADDYHAIEADREVDRAALRHRLEALLDERRGGEIEVSAGEPLEPIPSSTAWSSSRRRSRSTADRPAVRRPPCSANVWRCSKRPWPAGASVR
jgi:hypothetical protein